MPAGRSSARLEVSVVADTGDRGAVRGLAAWLAATAPRTARGCVTIAIVSDRRMRQLNGGFRGVDAATDVLSFPAFGGLPSDDDSGAGQATAARPRAAVSPDAPSARAVGPASTDLGDVAIARGVASRQARAAGHAVSTELRVLALHGLLHLLGYDHETDDGDMARVEARLRRKGGLRDGLIERTRRRA